MESFDLRPSFVQTCRSLARWRETRYQDDLRDQRNLVSAAGLRELAAVVDQLPPDDPHLLELLRLAASGNEFTPGQQTLYELGRFRFFQPDMEPDHFLDLLVEYARTDRNEMGRFGGAQVAGDEPW